MGARLKGSDRYAPMLKREEGRRCWTLLYRDNTDNPKEKYHMDILPSVADSKYAERMTRLFSESFSEQTVDQISIRITDKESDDYATATQIEKWLKSNPDGYALWFATRCIEDASVKLLAEAVVPIEKYNKDKTVLQRIVQILKRHRDMMFSNDKENEPISIIITTLAARAYKGGEQDLVDGLVNVVNNLEKNITKNDKETAMVQQREEAERRREAFLKEPICQHINELLHGRHITTRDTSFKHEAIALKEEDYKQLKEAVERHYAGFDNALLSRCPSLRHSDLALCHLHLMGLGEGEIAALRSRTYSGIKKQNESLQE
ncbi:MAG: hypothetical protein IJ057_02420, partial [Bacteroidales bacterium]|nr:hypothetical protein [Bacteroidales bacterium]